MKVPALTLWQPWASMIALGAKRIETRSWSTNYRGWLVIHAAKRFTVEERDICLFRPFNDVFKDANLRRFSDIPLGCGLCVARLDAVTATENCSNISNVERALGNYQPGRFAWIFGEVRSFEYPIAATGRQGLWAWPEPVKVESLAEIPELIWYEKPILAGSAIPLIGVDEEESE